MSSMHIYINIKLYLYSTQLEYRFMVGDQQQKGRE